MFGKFGKFLLALEPLILVVVTIAFWFDDPDGRTIYLLLFMLPILGRLIVYRRLWVTTPVNLFFYLFLLLCVVNTATALSNHGLSAPYSFGWTQVGRPLMGIVLALCMMSSVYEHKSAGALVLLLLAFCLFVGVVGLTAAQYTPKSDLFDSITNLLPKLRDLPGGEGGFNVNEIGGAMAFFAPFAAGFMIYEWRRSRSTLRIVLATLAFAVLMIALFLGQSRLAIIGVVVSLGLLIYLLIPRGLARWLAFGALLLFCCLEIYVVVDVGGLSDSSTGSRVEIWSAALTLIREHPLTGYGLNQFRRRDVRERLVPDYPYTTVPHAHNETLQIGSDLGLPGMFVYVAWNLMLLLMIVRAWQNGDASVRALALSAGAGLLGHAIFGLADAITLFDRFSFAHWLLIGTAGSAYMLSRVRPKEAVAQPAIP